MSEAKQTPILDLLRDVPADARQVYEHDSMHSQNIPFGRLAAEAADEIARLRAEVAGLREEVKEISGGAGVYMGLLVDCIAVLHTIEPESDYEAEKLRDLLDAIDRALEPTRHKGALL